MSILVELGHVVDRPATVVPDEATAISAAVSQAAARGARIVITTGGTGPGPRDVTPQALADMGLVELPGLGEAIRAGSRTRFPTTDLSRALGGTINGLVVLALPGSPGGVSDGLAAVGPLLAHAALMAGGADHRGHPTTQNPGSGRGDSPAATPTGGGRLVGTSPISEAEVAALVTDPRAGAVVTFAGRVRDHDGGRGVRALTYEAHPDAEQVMAGILELARTRPGILAAAARHRTGDLPIGALAFVAAVSAAHRGEAFAGCAWLVDEVKAELPVWKHQMFTDGTDEWVNSP